MLKTNMKYEEVEKKKTTPKKKKTGLFDFLYDISSSKKNILNEENINAYNNYMVNKFLSYNADCLFYVNEINKYNMPKEVHYKYLMNTIRYKRRSFNYYKPKNESAKYVSEYYKVSITKAIEYCNILSEEEIKTIKKKTDHLF